MTRKEAIQEANLVAQLYGAEVLKVCKQDGKWIGLFEEHGEKFYSELEDE